MAVNSFRLIRIAAEAELIRLRALLKRQARRGIYAVIAALLAISLLVLAEVLLWQVIRLYLEPIPTTASVFGINGLLMICFVWLARKSIPSDHEREALRVRQDALHQARASLLLGTAIGVGRRYLVRRAPRR